jgi:uncharacterized protein YkwD
MAMQAALRLLAFAVLCSGASTARAGVPATAKPALVHQRVLDLVNAARAHGRRCGRESFAAAPPLRPSVQLQKAATSHARDMATHNYFDHHAPDGSEPRDRVRRTGYRWSLIGENIAFGPATAEEVVAGWLASPGHCTNIMDRRFRDLGVGIATGRKRGHIYWVQEFGSPAR